MSTISRLLFDTAGQESNLWPKAVMDHLYTDDRHLACSAEMSLSTPPIWSGRQCVSLRRLPRTCGAGVRELATRSPNGDMEVGPVTESLRKRSGQVERGNLVAGVDAALRSNGVAQKPEPASPQPAPEVPPEPERTPPEPPPERPPAPPPEMPPEPERPPSPGEPPLEIPEPEASGSLPARPQDGGGRTQPRSARPKPGPDGAVSLAGAKGRLPRGASGPGAARTRLGL